MKGKDMFDSFKTLKAVRTIKQGGKAELSYCQIINLIINMPTVIRILPEKQKNEIHAIFDMCCSVKEKELLDLEGYCKICWDIISVLDEIAPYNLYCGDVDVELGILQAIRNEKADSSSTVEAEAEDDDISDAVVSADADENKEYNYEYHSSKKIVLARIKRFLEDNEYAFKVNEERDAIMVSFSGGNIFEVLYASFYIMEYGFKFEMVTDYTYKGEHSGELAKYLAAKNMLRCSPGAFMYDSITGYFGFTEFIDFTDCEPSDEVLEDCLELAVDAIFEIEQNLLKITSGEETAQDVLLTE